MLTLLEIFLSFGLLRMRKSMRKSRLTLRDRADWMHRSCSLVLRRISLQVTCDGRMPSSGLIVSNHLSYFDILLLASAGSCIFVSKSEVRSWPGFGLLASYGGTIFIERGTRAGAVQGARQVEEALRDGVTVVLFPEGTSSDGTTLLPFHSFLFEPAVAEGLPVMSASVSYEAAETEEHELCYYGDIHFFPHLLETLGRRNVRGKLQFDSPCVYSTRKAAVQDTWERVAQMRQYVPVETAVSQ